MPLVFYFVPCWYLLHCMRWIILFLLVEWYWLAQALSCAYTYPVWFEPFDSCSKMQNYSTGVVSIALFSNIWFVSKPLITVHLYCGKASFPQVLLWILGSANPQADKSKRETPKRRSLVLLFYQSQGCYWSSRLSKTFFTSDTVLSISSTI